MSTKPKQPVAVWTRRKGEPYVLFGKYLDGNSPYGDSGKTISEFIAEHGGAPVNSFLIEDGPHIERLEALFDKMERAGVIMLMADESASGTTLIADDL